MFFCLGVLGKFLRHQYTAVLIKPYLNLGGYPAPTPTLSSSRSSPLHLCCWFGSLHEIHPEDEGIRHLEKGRGLKSKVLSSGKLT